jgi:hypothetical protein
MVSASPVPTDALHIRYRNEGGYIDCYRTEIDRLVSLNQFIEAFYTSPLLKVERFILRWLVSKPSRDDEASQLARGEIDYFAAWTTETRTESQLLMRDYQGMTLSWFKVEAHHLYFGTAIVATKQRGVGQATQIPLMFRATL